MLCLGLFKEEFVGCGMKIIVGLGNPGPQYARTRHNAGFMVVDRLVEKFAPNAPVKGVFNAAAVEITLSGPSGDEKVLLLKPTTFMNRSGQSVSDAVRFYKLASHEDLLVVVDELYLPTGQVRMNPNGSPGGHNGLTDIQRVLGHQNYPRLRLGVGIQPSGGKPAVMDQADFVLSRFTPDEEPLLAEAVDKAAKAVENFVTRGLAHAMNAANGAAGSAGSGPPKPVAKPDAPSATGPSRSMDR